MQASCLYALRVFRVRSTALVVGSINRQPWAGISESELYTAGYEKSVIGTENTYD